MRYLNSIQIKNIQINKNNFSFTLKHSSFIKLKAFPDNSKITNMTKKSSEDISQLSPNSIIYSDLDSLSKCIDSRYDIDFEESIDSLQILNALNNDIITTLLF
jgi:hypothetical protein